MGKVGIPTEQARAGDVRGQLTSQHRTVLALQAKAAPPQIVVAHLQPDWTQRVEVGEGDNQAGWRC